MKKDNDFLIIAAVGIAAYLLFKKQTPAGVVTVGPLSPPVYNPANSTAALPPASVLSQITNTISKIFDNIPAPAPIYQADTTADSIKAITPAPPVYEAIAPVVIPADQLPSGLSPQNMSTDDLVRYIDANRKFPERGFIINDGLTYG